MRDGSTGSLVVCLLLFLCTLYPLAASDPVVVRDSSGEDLTLYETSFALVLGQSKYTGGWPPLPGVRGDVQQVEKLLRENGFDVETAVDLDHRAFRQAIEDFIARRGLDPGGRLLVYYAGHGHTEEQAYGEELGYLVPTDAPNPHVDRNGFLAMAMPMDQIEVYAKRIQTNHVLFLFDSCFSGSIFSLSRAIPENISYKTTLPVRQFITSGSAEEQVPDESVFRAQFIEALNGEGDSDRDGYVTGTELGEYLQKTVVNYSRGAQHPQYGKIRNPNLDKGDFVFALADGASAGPAPPTIKKADYSDLEARSKAKERWQPYQRAMQEEFETVSQLEEELADPADRAEAWERFLSNYQRENPFSVEDETMRGEAKSRLNKWRDALASQPAKNSPVASVPKTKPRQEVTAAKTPAPPLSPSRQTRPVSATKPRLLVVLSAADGASAQGIGTAETAVVSRLLKEGFQVVNSTQVERIRQNSSDMAAILAANEARIAAIAQQHGAEVMVVGKLTSEAEPALGRFYTGRAILDLRVYQAATGQYLGAESVQIGLGGTQGKMGPSEMTARSAACAAAGERGGEFLVEQTQALLGGPSEVVLVAVGASAGEAREIRQMLAAMGGVNGMSQRYFVAGERLELGVDFSGDSIALGDALDERKVGSRRLALSQAEPGRLTVTLE